MSRSRIREAMEQVHISEEMQEEMIANIQKRMDDRGRQIRMHRKMAASAAVLLLSAGIIAVPVRAVVENLVRERMENIPESERLDILDMVREQKVEADSFSREFSPEESRRMQELMQLYQNGTFPEQSIPLADYAWEVEGDALCYIWETGEFILPKRELTDEELLEIIDFNSVRSYALEQSPAAQEARAEYRAEQDRLKEQIQGAGAVSGQEALEIARQQLQSDFGEEADEMELLSIDLIDISGKSYGQSVDAAYNVLFSPPGRSEIHTYMVDGGDGRILIKN